MTGHTSGICNTTLVRRWAMACTAGLALTAFTGLGTPAAAQATPEATTGPTLTDLAVARRRDAETLVKLSAEGRSLYERDTVKLDGYGYCGQAVALAERGEFRQSIRAASKALHLGQTGGNQDIQSLAQRDLAIAYSYAGLLDEAERFAKGALALPANDPAQAWAPSHKILGDVAARRGQPVAAVAAYEKALELASPKFRPLVLLSLANAHVAANSPKEALSELDVVQQKDRDALGAAYARTRANALLADKQYDAALAQFRKAAADPRGAEADYERLWALEGEGRVFLAQGDGAQALTAYRNAAGVIEGLRSRFRSDEFRTGLFGDVQKVLDTALRLSVDAKDFETAWNLSEASRSRQLLDTLRDRATDTIGQRVSLADLRARLAPQDTVLQFHALEQQLVVWTIRREGLQGATVPVTDAALATEVEAFRQSVISRARDTQSRAQALHQRLGLPADWGGATRVFVVPHGALHYLPFQALHDGQQYLIAKTALSVWPSAGVGAQLLARTQKPARSLLAFGNPATDRNVPLPGAEREVQQLAALFNRRDVFTQRNATKSAFKTRSNQASLLHVAAHAEVDAVDPLFSRILLAPEGDDTGLLEAREIFNINLGGVSLVTLSACESGLGRVARGDEILGFTRSFLSAGANGVIASLWPVADESTEVLMTRLYRDLTGGADLMTAMQAAQVEVQKNRRFAHPFFWAPFNVIGNGRLELGN
jgi:CHAT domain-containing protein/tetratricopeptide (TPR) repeat protein